MRWNSLSPSWKVLFLGTDRFAIKILDALYVEFLKRESIVGGRQLVKRLDVVTKQSEGAVKDFVRGKSTDMKHFIWPDVGIEAGEFDVGVVASFGHLLPKSFIDLFPYGILNVHPSLLPRWRGCAPIPYTILAGDKKTGVTIQQIQPYKFDVGPIVNQREIPVPSGATSLQLLDILGDLGGDLLIETLQDLSHLEDIEIDQDDRYATYAYKINKQDSRFLIDWNSDTCDLVDRKFRAFGEMHNIWTYFGEYKVKLSKLVAPKEMQWYTMRDPRLAGRAGALAYLGQKDCVAIQCTDGLVGVREISVKKAMSAKSFYNGYLSKPEWKYAKFSNKVEPFGPTKQPKVLTLKKRLAHQKHWRQQLLRMHALPSDG
ncbi:methionyl-tRNA formyltransferase, mitochondrial-like isoform X2 [Watersipora subatra]